MKIAKEFHWEMGHRLPNHPGKCKNIHGHSYRMMIELEGKLNNEGMIIDYYDLKKIVTPLVERVDHCFMVDSSDSTLIQVLEKINSKMVIVNYPTTVENIINYFLSELKLLKYPSNITSIKVKIYETASNYAEESLRIP